MPPNAYASHEKHHLMGNSNPPGKLTGEQIDAIAEQFAARLRAGDSVSVNDYVVQHGHSETLCEVLAGVEVLESMKRSSLQPSPPASADLSRLTDYTIIREIGRGGMGVVYEAVHKSLHRKVAIKVLSANRIADNRQLARFQIEARAAARLRHPSIVPVFGVGCLDANEKQTHYYVMDYIAGQSLAQVLNRHRQASTASASARELTANSTAQHPTVLTQNSEVQAQPNLARSGDAETAFELSRNEDAAEPVGASTDNVLWAAQMGSKLADALEYAHSQGVLHRDIKPGNFILDEQGHPWLADFGLAKLSEPTTLTQTGEILGTPQYMPPEAFTGQYDVRSEIFALGLTLYECITLQNAYSGELTSAVIQQATAAEIRPPSTIIHSLPRDLETILLKCLAKEPNDRYSSAGQVRDDLICFIGGRPVSARRVGPLGRLLRWSRREPLAAGLTGASFLLVVALMLATSFGYWQTRQKLLIEKRSTAEVRTALAEKSSALDTANAAQRRAEANLQVALRAFKNISERITAATIESDADLLGEVTDTTAAGVTAEDAAVLESLLSFFDELATTNNTQLLRESAEAAQRAGDIYASLGQLSKSSESYDNASARFTSLRKQDDSNALRVAHAQLLNEISAVAALRGELLRAMQAFYETMDILDAIPEDRREFQSEFERARAYRLRAAIPDLGGSNSQLRAGRRPIFDRLANPSSTANFSIEVASKSIELLTKLSIKHPTSNVVSAELARAYRTRADAKSRMRQRDSAQEDISESIQIWEGLHRDQPKSDAIRYELASTLVRARNFGMHPITQAFRAHELTAELLRTAPDLPRYQSLRANSLQSLALAELRSGKVPAARRHLDEALETYTKLHQDSPEISAYALKRSAVLEAKADLEIRVGNPEAAAALFEDAVAQLRTAIDTNQSNASLLRIELQRLRRKQDRRGTRDE